MSLSDEQISQLAARIGTELTKENSLLATTKEVQAIARNVEALARDVQALVRNIPNVALKSVAPFVVNKGTKLEERAIAKGADSTWTYMRHGDKLLAVSAAHCATHPLDWGDSQPPAKKQKESKKKKNARGPAQGKDTWHFCEVPLVLAPFVKSAYFLPHVIGVKGEDVPTEEDIVALELDQETMPLVGDLLTNRSVLNWRTVAGQYSQINLQNCSLAGVGLAGIVHAPSCAWDHHKKYIVFNPDNSEEGHSGTVMIDLSQRDTQLCDQAVGVLIGEVARDGLKPRGEVCPLPDFSNLIEYKVVATPPSSEIKFNLLFLEKRKRSKKLVQVRTKTFKRVSGTDHEYGEISSSGSRTVYGVFVAPPASP
jgi:hypothetical protein